MKPVITAEQFALNASTIASFRSEIKRLSADVRRLELEAAALRAREVLLEKSIATQSGEVAKLRVAFQRSVALLSARREVTGRLDVIDNIAKMLDVSLRTEDADKALLAEFWVMNLVPKASCTIEDARLGAMKDKWSCSGNYFIWSKGVVVYVGASRNIWKRITSVGRDAVLGSADGVSALPCKPGLEFLNERFYQWLLIPERNSFGS